ncbi:hypothetical protein [uncultured Reyranella sp.]|uniref:hypothetical protein n=1 Tax=uncultured Reyranella sp. TaxID=735512 RepID=UPI0025DAD122|nr:hypothetical protein [uncultured Reyranella sp.]
MTSAFIVSAVNLRDYAKSRGWLQREDAVADRLYILSHPSHESRELVFPIDDNVPDSAETVMLAAQKLAALENRELSSLIQDTEEIRDDTFKFHILGDSISEQAIPLVFATAAMAGAEQMLLSAASTVLKPQQHHPRLGRAEAQQLLHAANFRQTDRGSFVLKVSCRVTALSVETPLFHDEIALPFVRKTTLLATAAINSLVQAIEADTLDRLVETTLASSAPMLSSNICEALTKFYDESLQNSLQIQTSWSPNAPMPKGVSSAPSVIRVQREYFSRIEEVRVALKSGSPIHEGTFIGTVEELDGDVGEDGRRYGLVTLFLLLHETDQIVTARIFLDPDQYATAHQAHMAEGAYVSVTGKLQSKRQPYVFTEVSDFSLVPKSTRSR